MEKNNKQNQNRAPRAPYVPKIDNDQAALIDFIATQIDMFMTYANAAEDYDVKGRMAEENKLFSLAETPELSQPAKFFMLQRSVRTDRTTHTLTRAATSMLVTSEDKDPAYFITAYLTGEGMGNVQVIPIGPEGPVGRDTAMLSIKNWKMTKQWIK